MDSDDFRFWAIILGAIGVAFAAAIGSSWVVCHHIERMAELGYEEEPVPGSSRLMWRRRTPPPPKVEPKLDLAPVRPVTPEDIIEYITTNVPPNLYDLVSVDETVVNAWTNGLVASVDSLRGEIDCLVRCVERLEGKVEDRVRPPDVTCARCGQKHAWSDVLNCYIGVVAKPVWEAK